ncbi:MAG: metal-sensing transcriptional repressor [Longicatena sp.]
MNEERKKACNNLKTARGQLDGILKMIEDERYCIDISNQISAATALLKKANMHILSGHLHTCVKSAIEASDADQKVAEIEEVIARLMK